MSTVIAAVIGAVVGSLGGAYLGVTIGADRDDERSEREFWRSKRVEVYGEFLAAAEESRQSMEGYLLPAQRSVGVWGTVAQYPEPPEQLLKDVSESMRGVHKLAGQISFLSEDLMPLAEALREELDGAQTFMFYVTLCHGDTADGVPCDVRPDEFPLQRGERNWWSLSELKSDYDNFMHAAQKQLDVSD